MVSVRSDVALVAVVAVVHVLEDLVTGPAIRAGVVARRLGRSQDVAGGSGSVTEVAGLFGFRDVATEAMGVFRVSP